MKTEHPDFPDPEVIAKSWTTKLAELSPASFNICEASARTVLSNISHSMAFNDPLSDPLSGTFAEEEGGQVTKGAVAAKKSGGGLFDDDDDDDDLELDLNLDDLHLETRSKNEEKKKKKKKKKTKAEKEEEEYEQQRQALKAQAAEAAKKKKKTGLGLGTARGNLWGTKTSVSSTKSKVSIKTCLFCAYIARSLWP